jgi:signal peptidase I
LLWKPKPWIAVVLSVISAPLGLLYAAKPRLAALFLAILVSLAAIDFSHVLRNALGAIALILQIVASITGIVLAYRTAKTAPDGIQRWYSRWYGLAGIGGLLVLAVVTFRVFLYEPFRIPSSAMRPTLEVGARIIVQKIGYGHPSAYGVRIASWPLSAPLKRGDIIVFDYPVDPAQAYVKRIVGLPGDRVIYSNKQLFVNGKNSRVRQLNEYLHSDVPRFSQRFRDRLDDTEFDTLADNDKPLRANEPIPIALRDRCVFSAEEIRCDVPAGNYFVMGDNRDNSYDSRYWGFVRSELIVGKVVKIIP